MTDHFVRPDVHGFLEALKAIGGPDMSTMPLADARAAYVAMKDFGEVEPRDLAVIRDLTCPGPAGAIPLRFYDARESREPGPVVMFFHGGGFTIGDLETHHALCTEIAAELDLPVVAVDYRLAPEHPFPAAPDDCEAAARWVAGSPAELGRTVTGLIPMGDSAGGNLAIVITQALMAAPAAAPVVLQVPIYPLSDEKPDHVSMQRSCRGPAADPGGDGMVLGQLCRRSRPPARLPDPRQPRRDAADRAGHRRARSDPRFGPGLWRAADPGRVRRGVHRAARARSTASPPCARRCRARRPTWRGSSPRCG